MKGQFSIILILGILFQFSCKGKEILIPTVPPVTNNGVVSVWKTNKDGSITLYKEPLNIKYSAKQSTLIDINFNSINTKQEMDGFGASLTGSSAFVLMKHLTASQRTDCLKELFDTSNGIGLSYLRLTMGASDFSLTNYTYHDIPLNQTDTSMSQFSIGSEEEFLIPVLKEILAINPNLKIMASPWSAPAWMKSNKSLIQGGSVNANYYRAYAKYFVKYIQAFQSNGIDIDAITIQNEPLYAAPYMSTEMSAQAQAEFIRTALGPAFTENNIKTKIVIYDHNWDRVDYPLSVLSDADARKYIAGTAFHCYGGNVAAMSQVQSQYPDKGIYFTECSGGYFSPGFSGNLAWNSENLIIGSPRNGAKTVLFWNLALDENHGPRNGGCQDCRGVITINSINNLISKNVEYYALGHSSKFLLPKAKRIETSDIRALGISQVAYLNLDGSKVLVVFNHQSTTQKIQVNDGNNSFNYSIESGSLITFKW
jgi:glucosylceramidase